MVELAAGQLAGVEAEGGGDGQGDQADGDDLAAPARQPAGQQRGQDQEPADDQVAGEQLDHRDDQDEQVREQPAAGGRDHPGAGRDRPGRLLHVPPLSPGSRLACPTEPARSGRQRQDRACSRMTALTDPSERRPWHANAGHGRFRLHRFGGGGPAGRRRAPGDGGRRPVNGAAGEPGRRARLRPGGAGRGRPGRPGAARAGGRGAPRGRLPPGRPDRRAPQRQRPAARRPGQRARHHRAGQGGPGGRLPAAGVRQLRRDRLRRARPVGPADRRALPAAGHQPLRGVEAVGRGLPGQLRRAARAGAGQPAPGQRLRAPPGPARRGRGGGHLLQPAAGRRAGDHLRRRPPDPRLCVRGGRGRRLRGRRGAPRRPRGQGQHRHRGRDLGAGAVRRPAGGRRAGRRAGVRAGPAGRAGPDRAGLRRGRAGPRLAATGRPGRRPGPHLGVGVPDGPAGSGSVERRPRGAGGVPGES